MPKKKLSEKAKETGDCPKCLKKEALTEWMSGSKTGYHECMECGNWWDPEGNDCGREVFAL